MKSTRTIRLTQREEEALAEIAVEHECFNPAGEPSWRALVAKIAAGYLEVRDPLRRKIFLDFRKAPDWWRPAVDGSMPLIEVVKATKAKRKELLATGMKIEGDRVSAPWKAWREKTPSATQAPVTKPDWWQGPAMPWEVVLERVGYDRPGLVSLGFLDLGDTVGTPEGWGW